MTGETRVVQLDIQEREKLLSLEKRRQEREAHFKALLARYCETHYVRIPDNRLNSLARNRRRKYFSPGLKKN
jgi:hypothetical protein